MSHGTEGSPREVGAGSEAEEDVGEKWKERTSSAPGRTKSTTVTRTLALLPDSSGHGSCSNFDEEDNPLPFPRLGGTRNDHGDGWASFLSSGHGDLWWGEKQRMEEEGEGGGGGARREEERRG